MGKFSSAKQEFDYLHQNASHLARSLVPVDGKIREQIKIRGADNTPLEEYYKWQFLSGLINSGLFPKDYLGAEVRFPKGSKTSNPLKLDAAIFDDPSWITHYQFYWAQRDSADLEWLNDHLLAVIEFKKNDKEIERVFSGQIKPAMREKDPATAYVLGVYYDTERLYLFHRRDGRYLRYDESKNQKRDDSKVGDLSLHLPDPYLFLPDFDSLRQLVHRPTSLDRSSRSIGDLDIITSIATVQLQSALSDVLKALDRTGLVNQRGYQIIVESLALKIFDEKRNERNSSRPLDFYVTEEEAHFSKLSEAPIQRFVRRMIALRTDAEGQYQTILQAKAIDWLSPNHVSALVAVCKAFQDFSFVLSSTSDLYQLVFYNFANTFKRDESAQFLTPFQLINFLVQIVNPRNGETLIDPCCGIGDFLSLSFVQSQGKAAHLRLKDSNIFGVDIDENMIMLATVNMLLNGDGETRLFHKPDKGSILWKLAKGNPPSLVELEPAHHKKGTWDNWKDTTQLMKFDVVLTNPPFGDGRPYRPDNQRDRELIECYETWALAGDSGKIDRGIVFLENAYHILKPGGRMGIVLSNSIASIKRWELVRKWFMHRMRIVALFDLPSNVFAETGVNTTLLVAYKPKPEDAEILNEQGYNVFVRDIQRVGYEVRTVKRNVFFNTLYKFNTRTFEIETDGEGRPVVDEEFSEVVSEFRHWALSQEHALQQAFVRED